MTERGFVRLHDRGVLSVEGADAEAFLQGLVSNDVARVTERQAGYGALLTPQGKFLFDFLLYRTAEGFLLETEAARLPDLIRRLTLYKLRSKVTLADMSERHAVLALLSADDGPGASEILETVAEGIIVADPRLADLGRRALLPPDAVDRVMGALGLAELPVAAWEKRRLALGVPDGSRDIEVEKGILLENGFEELGGVAFDKGCFVGQELTARTKYRGLIKKRLLPVVFEGALPEPGTIIRLGEREAGEVRSAADGRGLALIRLDQLAKAEASGLPLQAGDTVVRPQPPSWVRIARPDVKA
ncbi:CAF17-like 4Fe-4S cluster assembly/insertion protein YgfZ [Marinivivus vitaminiproducens]|uniref:CAF17-like 4Fe-4S cluster assembly/insertion protein YgfZ n=1 Tax=Marinivivus vitaminiproducens TaxID=3035935 RepID=UPI00279D9608|nr:folate-binding protein [Geminicoccaceae bacterium SCSIO 64248]